ncbi:MAG: SRPBCC family protein [Microcoleus sp. SIO2G3]|nr:SRPBCC family protein [Microcoleus sp. SIO2G3]
MSSYQFEQSIAIQASATAVEQCLTDLKLMHRWLNPALRCEPIGEWSTTVGSKSRFVVQIPLVRPTLNNVVLEREPGLIVWGFDGFFKGRDRWECQPREDGTYLVNRFEFTIPNSIVRYGFDRFAANLTRQDMQAQLRRLKRVAEDIYIKSGESLPIRVRQPL